MIIIAHTASCNCKRFHTWFQSRSSTIEKDANKCAADFVSTYVWCQTNSFAFGGPWIVLEKKCSKLIFPMEGLLHIFPFLNSAQVSVLLISLLWELQFGIPQQPYTGVVTKNVTESWSMKNPYIIYTKSTLRVCKINIFDVTPCRRKKFSTCLLITMFTN